MRSRRLVFGVLVVAGCASPLTVAEDRDASTGGDAAPRFNPATPSDGSRDAFDELPSLGDPPEDGGDGG